jgi:hypothetical protein
MPRLSSAAVGALLFANAPSLAAQSAPASPRLTLGGEVNVQYAASSVDARPSGFTLRRARLNGVFVVSELVDAYVQAELAATGGAELRDAWVRFTLSPALELSAGQFKRAFDLFELDSFTDLSLIERDGRVGGVSTCAGVGSVCSFSRFTEALGYAGRDQGVRLEGTAGRVGYLATATNGTGQNVPEENHAKSLSGRVSVGVSAGVRVGAQLALHEWADASDSTRHASAWSADVSYGAFRSGLLLQAALTGGDNWSAEPARGGAPTFLAVQGMAAWYLPLAGHRLAAMEPLLRLSWGDPDTDAADDAGLLVTPGFMLYVAGKNKIGFNLDVWSPRTGDTEYSLKIQSYIHI